MDEIEFENESEISQDDIYEFYSSNTNQQEGLISIQDKDQRIPKEENTQRRAQLNVIQELPDSYLSEKYCKEIEGFSS